MRNPKKRNKQATPQTTPQPVMASEPRSLRISCGPERSHSNTRPAGGNSTAAKSTILPETIIRGPLLAHRERHHRGPGAEVLHFGPYLSHQTHHGRTPTRRGG